MEISIFTLSLVLFINNVYAQLKKDKEKILAEAYLLYNSEKASWNETNIFLEKFLKKRSYRWLFFLFW